jgi:hypothetical protein
MSFDPDAYLAKKSAPQGAQGFNPDAYIAKKIGREPSQFPVSNLPPDQGVIQEGQPIQAQPAKPKRVPIENSKGDIVGYRELDDDPSQAHQSFLESAANTVAMGYLPQLQAAAEEYLMPDPNKEVDAQLRGQGFQIPESSYVQKRDENIARQERQFQENPGHSLAGMAAGIGVTAPIATATAGAAGLGKGVGMMSRAKDAAMAGAGYSALVNPGDIEGEVNPLQASERAGNAAKGAALGVVAQGAGEVAAKTGEAIRKAPEFSDKIANVAAVKSIGAIGRDFKKLFGGNNAQGIGETLIKKNIVKTGDSIDEIAQKTMAAKAETGKKIGEINEKVNDFIEYNKTLSGSGFSAREKKLLEISRLDGKKLANIAQVKIEKALKNNLNKTKIMSQVDEYLQNLRNLGDDVSMKDLLDARYSLDDVINYSKEIRDLPAAQQNIKTIRDVLNKAVENRVRVVGKVVKDPTLISDLKAAKSEYGHLSKASSISSNRAKELEGHNYFTFSENIVGGIAGAGSASASVAQGDDPLTVLQKGVVGYLAGAAARKTGKYAPQALSKVAKRFSLVMKQPSNMAKYGQPLIEAAKKSPNEFQALFNQLQNDPGFKKLLGPQGEK